MQLQKATPTEIMSIGKAFAESGMFPDIKSAAQAIVKIQAGSEIGIPPFASMSGIHIIQGKPTIGAGVMAAMVKGSNKYDYRVIESSELICSIDFFQGKEKIGNSTFTIADAKKAGTKNLDKFPKNMLFARAMSNGVKWYTPDVFAGPVYVPEEMEAPIVTEEVKAEVIEVVTADQAKIMINAVTDVDVIAAVYKSLPKELQKDKSVIAHCAAKKQELLNLNSEGAE
jgi:hypothetical protein